MDGKVEVAQAFDTSESCDQFDVFIDQISNSPQDHIIVIASNDD